MKTVKTAHKWGDLRILGEFSPGFSCVMAYKWFLKKT